uniref:Zinc-ribbon domain-containing protein n=1 Tax=Kalanchoe fedtschenkoi TaxID=63787 RepID=A0A7N0TI15_KALFE
MNGGLITNVRLVKCPKCSRVLPELADVPVYRCGGCRAILQAKNRKTKIEDTKSVSSGSALAPTTDLGHTSDDIESSSPGQIGSHIPATGNSGDQSNYYPEKSPVTEIDGGNISNEHSVDNELLSNDEGNSGQNELQERGCDFKKGSKDEMEIARARARARRLYLSTNLPNELSSSGNQTPNGLDHTLDSPSSFNGSGSEKIYFNKRNSSTVDVDAIGTYAVQSKEAVQGSQENITHENATNNGSSGVDADELLINRKGRPIVATGGTHHRNASIPETGVYSGLDSVDERASSFSSPVSEELQSIGAQGSSPKEDASADEISYRDVIKSQTSEKAERSLKCSPNGYDTVNHAHELEVTAETDPSSELSYAVGQVFKSATTKSGHFYDGSISSYEDQDDQIYMQTLRDVNYVENVGRRSFHKNEVSGVTAMQQQAREFFSSETNNKTTQESLRSPVESGEPMRHQIRNQIGLGSGIYPAGAPFNTRGYENGGPSSAWLDGVRSNSSVYSADKLPYTEKERIELLKMVYELHDELSRAPTNTGNVDRRNLEQSRNGRQMAAPYPRREFMDEADLQSKYLRYPFTRSEQGTNWPRQQHPSWMHFSGEVTNHRHYDEYSCQHRQPTDHRFSAQIAPSACSVCSINAGPQRVHLHSGEQFYNPYSSSTSSPQRYLESEYPLRVRDVTYDDPRLMERYVEASLANSRISTDHVRQDEMKKLHVREKQLRIGRHIRPITGGAPFVTCYQCWSLLQLPADSFLFKRRFHELKCGSCSKILKFSLENRTHVVPYVNEYRAPSPSEIRGRSPVRNGTSHLNRGPHFHAIQTSCSDHEYGNSYCRSCSTTEGEQVFLAAPAHAGQAGNAGGKKTSPRGSSDILEGRKKRFSKQLFSKEKQRPMETPEIAANRTFNIENYSSESRQSKSRNGSPLHRLMGYSSISQVFRGPSKGASESFRNKSAR